jgi:hypothetical protein
MGESFPRNAKYQKSHYADKNKQGVCWMFYPAEQGNNDNTTKVPAQYILASEGFMESWAQNLSQPDLDEGKRQAAPLYARRASWVDNVITAANIQVGESLYAYSQAQGNDALRAQAANNYSADASLVRRSSPPAAPHYHMQNSLAHQHYTPQNLVGESQDPGRPPLQSQLV